MDEALAPRDWNDLSPADVIRERQIVHETYLAAISGLIETVAFVDYTLTTIGLQSASANLIQLTDLAAQRVDALRQIQVVIGDAIANQQAQIVAAQQPPKT